MNARAAHILTRMYPRWWRHRYGAEFEALLQEMPLTPHLVADVLSRAAQVRKLAIAVFVLIAAIAAGANHLAVRAHALQPLASNAEHLSALPECHLYSSIPFADSLKKRPCLT